MSSFEGMGVSEIIVVSEVMDVTGNSGLGRLLVSERLSIFYGLNGR